MSKTLIVIPARYLSSRLPGKPLKDIAGQTLIERVWRQARQVSQAEVVIASDDERILNHAKSFGARVIATSAKARTGSDRVAEALELLERSDESYDLVANVQGDMPFINPRVISKAIETLINSSAEVGLTTIATPIYELAELNRPDTVKVVLGDSNRALYFSRAPVPFARDGYNELINAGLPLGFKHVGLYVFRPKVLQYFATLGSTAVEEIEKLEQLRALAYGISMNVCVVERELMVPSIEVDTPEDLERAVNFAERH